MTSIGDGEFHKGQPVWVIEPDGSRRAADFVGEGDPLSFCRCPRREIRPARQ
jgi:hypothetical protein